MIKFGGFVKSPTEEGMMNFRKHLETAWNQTLQFIAPLIFMTLVMFIVSFLTLGILAPVTMAGYIQSILLMLRDGREPKIQDIFSQMGLFFPLFGFGIVVFLFTLIGFVLLVLPGVLFIIAVLFFCFYMIPLMTDQKLGLIEAIKKSYAMSLEGNKLDHLVTIILFVGITAIGSSIFIGLLFTQPLATVFFLSVYEEKI